MNIYLPRLPHANPTALERAVGARRSCREYASTALGFEQLARILWAAQGTTGAVGQKAAPSAGAQYPLAIDAVAGRIENLAPGAYRYLSVEQQLRCSVEGDLRGALCAAALDAQPWVEQAAMLVVISADFAAMQEHFREQSPRGKRGERYIYLETGAVAQNICLQAVCLDLGAVIVGGFDDALVSSVLHLPARLKPTALVCIGAPA